MNKEMQVDSQTEAEIAEDTGHELGCLEWGLEVLLEWGLEVLLERGVDELEIYAVWISGGTGCWCREVREMAGLE